MPYGATVFRLPVIDRIGVKSKIIAAVAVYHIHDMHLRL